MAKQYRVLNPRGLPPRIPVLSWDVKDKDGKKTGEVTHWYEGDVITLPKGLDPTNSLRKGLLEVVKDG